MRRRVLPLASAALYSAMNLIAGPSGGQASITLLNSGANICYAQNTNWSLGKDNNTSGTVLNGDSITWTVHVAKVGVGDKIICVVGAVTVSNTGTAPATIGNIVANLQKPSSAKNTPWVSAAVDVADGTNGDGATTSKILASASQENPSVNASLGTNDYTISGSAGTFTETAASGELSFTDASNNSVFSLVPQVSLAPGASITLLYTAKYNNTILKLPVGGLVRAEIVVSFGNAGGRGGSGASGQNIDINGNGKIDADEANVRSVPTRLTLALPALQLCNSTVHITDSIAALGVNGGAAPTYDAGTNDIGAGVDATDTIQYTVQVTNVQGVGALTNSAALKGDSTTVTVVITDPSTLIQTTYTFPCCVAVDLSADSAVNVSDASIGGFADGQFCSASAAEFGTLLITDTSTLIKNQFSTDFPSGLGIGATGFFTASWDSSHVTALRTALRNASGASGPLTASTANATAISGGNLTGEVAALGLNIGFSGAPLAWPSGFGNLKVCATGTEFDGMTLSGVLNRTNQYIGGQSTIPTGFGLLGNFNLNAFILKLNRTFTRGNACQVSAFAQQTLSQTTCP